MKRIFVLCILLFFYLTGCATNNRSHGFLQVDFPDPPPPARDDSSRYYVIRVTEGNNMVILGTVEEVYPEVFIGGEGLPKE